MHLPPCNSFPVVPDVAPPEAEELAALVARDVVALHLVHVPDVELQALVGAEVEAALVAHVLLLAALAAVDLLVVQQRLVRVGLRGRSAGVTEGVNLLPRDQCEYTITTAQCT